MFTPADVGPSPATFGLVLPWWLPYATAAAVIVLVPFTLVNRVRSPRHPNPSRWLTLIPMAGCAILAWASLDTYVMELGWQNACGSQRWSFGCYPADVTLLIAGVGLAALTLGLAAALLMTVGGFRAPAFNRGPLAGFLVLLCASSFGFAIVALTFGGQSSFAFSLGVVAGWVFLGTGFFALTFVFGFPTSLSGPWARPARWLALLQGIISMAAAFVAASAALGPPPVFA